MHPRPFTVDVPGSTLDDLHRRLDLTRWPNVILGSGWDYGADVAYVKELCDYWRTFYDWRAHEAELNRYPQFLCAVDAVDLHFWHVRGKGPQPFPLLLIHGWPGSMFEFFALISRLTDPAAHGGDPADAFDLVIPSLPGFGFGGKPTERGWGVTRIAAAFDHLMAESLGYQRYGVQGGDWGGIIGAKMGSAHAAHIGAIHLNMVVGGPPADPTAEDRDAKTRRDLFQASETGYSHIQGTKPSSLALAQSDSPAGLAAWVVEKFRTWSDCEGDIETAFTKDVLLTNLMFYWLPNSVASSARIYYEARRDPGAFRYPRVEVPTAVASFPKEPWRVPRRWVEPHFNLVRWTDMPRGGHFAALEQPGLLADDVQAFFRTVR